ncbi:MAG: hypothetical protein HUK20_12955, partial [Fibrobacter sp.]|nr:hypothetical protein [Fibrobacter sp.]
TPFQYWGKADWFLEQLHAHCRKHSKTNPNAPRYAGRIVEMVEDIKKMREEDIEPKYEILYHFPQVLDRNGQKLYRIRALKDIPNPRRRVKEGDIGGYIWGEHNLSQVGNCWVFDDAKVYELGRLEDHATAHDNAQIFECSDLCENAVIHENAKAYGDSYMVGESEIRGTAEITDFAVMYECSRAYDNAKIFDWAHMMGDSSVCDNAHVYGHSIITGNARIVGNASVGGLSEIGMMSVVHENEIVIDEHIFEI